MPKTLLLLLVLFMNKWIMPRTTICHHHHGWIGNYCCWQCLQRQFVKFLYFLCFVVLPASIKESDIGTILDKLNGFHSSLRFTVDKVGNRVVHYLDFKVFNYQVTIYYEDTHTAQYMLFNNFASLPLKTALIISFFQRSLKICNNEALFNQ